MIRFDEEKRVFFSLRENIYCDNKFVEPRLEFMFKLDGEKEKKCAQLEVEKFI